MRNRIPAPLLGTRGQPHAGAREVVPKIRSVAEGAVEVRSRYRFL